MKRTVRTALLALACSLVVQIAVFTPTLLPQSMHAVQPSMREEFPGFSATSVIPDCSRWTGGAVHIYNVQIRSNATNVSASWDQSLTSVLTTFYWGNTTAYTFPSFQVKAKTSYGNGSGLYTIPKIDYLGPNLTYSFEISVSPPAGFCGAGPWIHKGTWTDSPSATGYFQGTVKDGSGAQAPAGDVVYIICRTGPGPLHRYLTSGLTGQYHGYGTGYYAVSTPCSPSEGRLYQVVYTDGYAGGPGWPGHWNATLSVLSPGWFNIVPPLDFKTWLPSSAEFVHSAYADLTSYSAEIYTTTQNTWNYGGSGGQTETSTTTAWGTSGVPSGDSLLVSSQVWTTGTSLFNATNGRTTSLSSLHFFSQIGGEFSVNGWIDWQSTVPSTGFCEKFNTVSAIYTLTISGSVATTSGYDTDISISAPIPGSPSVSVPLQNTLESTTGYSTTVLFTLTNPYPVGTYAYFLINTEGGTGPSSSFATVAHVWQVGSC